MFRHCMPPDNARRLLDMATGGAFTVTSELSSVSYDEEGAVFLVAAGGTSHRVEWLVDATGTGFALDCSDSWRAWPARR
jgi:hypothetical protein